MNDFTKQEMQLVMDHRTLEIQLRHLRRVMNSSITPKKLKKLETVDLPQLITREYNLRSKVEALMKKKGYVPRAV